LPRGRADIRALREAEEDDHDLAVEIGQRSRLAVHIGQRQRLRIGSTCDVDVLEGGLGFFGAARGQGQRGQQNGAALHHQMT
jgi:hypothetical protein